MSHFKERGKKNCLNCGTVVQGKYCHICGQENVEPKETIWHLVSHFFRDITHFDGNFFSTLKRLIARPGFLSKEYMLGRRASYINPVRMYIFTSAFFFLIFFNFFKSEGVKINSSSDIFKKTIPEVDKMDSSAFADFTRKINREDGKKDVPMTRQQFKIFADSAFEKGRINLAGIKYRSKAEYDSVLLTGTKKHNWVQRQFIYKIIAVNEKYKNNAIGLLKAFRESLLHSLPQMLFISLPLLALLLKWLYFRRKEFYYVNHAIFSIHLYIFFFIALLIILSFDKLGGMTGWSVFRYFNFALYLSMFFYTYKAMRKFYGQRRAKTIFKYGLLLFSFLIMMILLFTFFLFFSFFTI